MDKKLPKENKRAPVSEGGSEAGEPTVGFAFRDVDDRLVFANATLHTLVASWGTPEEWWRMVRHRIRLPLVGNCTHCGRPQHVGGLTASLSDRRGERIFDITFAGHNHGPVEGAVDMVMVRDITERERKTRALEEMVKQFRSICENIQDVYYRVDLTGRILFLSPSVLKLLSYEAEELVGRSLVDLCVDPDYWPELLEILQGTEDVSDFDMVFQCKLGRQVPVSVNARLVINGSTGQAVAIEGIFHDVTERNQLDAMLVERNNKLQETMAELQHQKFALDQHAIVSVADSSGRIIYANRKLIEISQYAQDELRGESHQIFNSSFHPKSFFKEMWRTIVSGQVWHGQIRNKRKDGAFYWVDCTIVPFMTPAGEPYQYVSISTDISERVQAERRLEQNRSFLLSITDAMGEGVYVLDRQGRLKFLNREAEKLLGFREEELLGKSLHDAVHFQKADGTPIPAEECTVHRSVLGRSFRMDDDWFTRKDGTLFPVSYVTAPLMEAGEINGSVAVFRDITDRKHADEELRKARDMALETSRLKSEFLANMSHEIRTPMNAIIGMTDLLLDTPLNDEQYDFAEIVRDSANSLLSIINDILDFSKIEAGKIDIETLDFSLLRVVEGTAELLATQAHDKRVSLMTYVDPAIPKILKGDPGRVRQMLVNLTGNAIKFTEEGEVVIRVGLLAESATRVTVHFSVRDTGVGLSPMARQRLFKPFTQADGATTRKYGGTGLGLAICNRLVGLMGGEIGVDSKEDEGSTFWFTIPFARSDAQPRGAAHDPSTLAGLSILLISENPSDLTILSDYLRAWGMRCESARSGQEGLRLLDGAVGKGKPFNLVITAAILPDMESLELIKLVRENALLAETRLIFLADVDNKEWDELAYGAGFAHGLIKPLCQSDLMNGLMGLFFPVVPSEEEGDGDAAHGRETTPVLPAPDAYDALESGKLLLLAEDNPVNRKVALMQLKKLGYAAHAVTNGKEAVEAASHLPYALILMDCQMPVMDGFEATHVIRRAENGSTRHIPIIAMTANAMKGDRERCLKAGMDDYLSKPVSPEELRNKLEQWIPRKTGDLPPIELGQLRQLFGNDDAVIRDLLSHFLPSVEELLQRLREGITGAQVEVVAEVSLELKGACANIGASGMEQLLRRLEMVVSEGDWEEAGATMEVLLRAFGRVQAFAQDF